MSDNHTTDPSSSSAMTAISLFTRIRDADGFLGTVVYVGGVASSKNPNEPYAGIVWDDHSRGKHDGSVISRTTNQLVRHFSCGPTQGSFVRPRKLDFGVALTENLLREKYVDLAAPVVAPNNILPHSMMTSSGREKTIEFLGELQIRKHQQLETMDRISLRRAGIAKASEERMDDFAHIREIDLAGNLLWNWQEVFRIMEWFPLLENFSLAHNFVRNMETRPLSPLRFDNLKTLNLNNCAITSFGTIQIIGKMTPNLESLCIANSNLSDIEEYSLEDDDVFQNLRQLDCSSCGLDRWENQVSKLERLPLLESLSIDDNPISSIPPGAGTSPSFQSLLSLQISGTQLSTWNDMEAITSFAKLVALRIKNLPLTANLGQAEVRSISIARFPNMEYLNASRISTEERIEAERRYVTLVSRSLQRASIQPKTTAEGTTTTKDDDDDDDDESQSSPEQLAILQEHPRYAELMEKHKSLATMLKKGMQSGGTLGTSIYNITIKSMAASSCTMEPIVRRLPGTMNVERMKAMCSRTFDIDFDLLCLRFVASGDSLPMEMDEDSKTLDYYGLCDGAEVLVDEIDLQAKALDSKRNDEELEKKITELDRSIQAMQKVRIRR